MPPDTSCFRDHLNLANAALTPEAGNILSRSSLSKGSYADNSFHAFGIPSGSQEPRDLVDLIEANTAATGKAQILAASDTVYAMHTQRGKRKRESNSLENGSPDAAPVCKRARVHPTSTAQEILEDTRSGGSDLRRNLDSRAESAPPCSTNTPGVHSAAALFRRPSEKTTRRYTRLPMSILFMSLQLSPENFLLLQAEAKSYMLDAAYPERQNCVGNRGKGDTDMVKLRLFNCAREFIERGAGERFFGEAAASQRQREGDSWEAVRALGKEQPHTQGDLVWPRDGTQLIGLITPLLRRMVTNERQRVYAIETRKRGARGKEGNIGPAVPVSPTAMQQDAAGFAMSPLLQNYDTRVSAGTFGRRSNYMPTNDTQSSIGSQSTDFSTSLSLPFACSSVNLSQRQDHGRPQAHELRPYLKHMNIFLRKDKNIIGSIRFRHAEEAPLSQILWSDLANCIARLRKQCDYMTRHPLGNNASEMNYDAIRGVTRAANQVQAGGSDSGDALVGAVSHSHASALDKFTSDTDGLQHVATSLLAGGLPRMTRGGSTNADPKPSEMVGYDSNSLYRVEAMRPTGRVVVQGESDWEALKVDIASADWADETLNVVIILR